MLYRLMYGGLIAALALAIGGCATTQGDWEIAEHDNTAHSYDHFLSDHPDSKFSATAAERRKRLLLESIQRSPTETNIRLTSRFYPGIISDEELEATIRQGRFLAAKRTLTVQAYEQFISQYPAGDDTALLQNELPTIRIFENARPLAETLIRMFPKATVRVDGLLPTGEIAFHKPDTYGRDRLTLEQLLKSGADPNAVRISGAAGAERNRFGYFGGNPGSAVPATESGGMSLLEYSATYGMDDVIPMLRAHGAQ